MSDLPQVLGILKLARGLVDHDWGSGSLDSGATGSTCASVAIGCSSGGHVYSRDAITAHVAVLRGAGIEVPTEPDSILNAVYRFNDSHTHAEVLAAFDKAITSVEAEIAYDAFMAEPEPEPTPQADATIEVILAIEEAGSVLARQIVREHPMMDEREVRGQVAAELFSAAQDAAWAFDLGVRVERGEPNGGPWS